MNPMTEYADVWEALEGAPRALEPIANLYHWSTNFGPGTGPFALFLDLIGWTDEHLGEPIYALQGAGLGCVGLDKLADALKTYADHPGDAREYVDLLMDLESR